jgi:hypothetical protein
MMKMQNRRNLRERGSALNEIGPALFILLIFIFFPCLDLLSMAAGYASCMYLNQLQAKEAAVDPASDAKVQSGKVRKTVVDNWLQNGVGRFVKTTSYPNTTVSYHDGQTDPTTKITDKIVTVTTTIECLPFLTIPFFFPIPGLSAPMSFTFSTNATMENPDLVNT